MAETKIEEKKAEPTFGEKLALAGWAGCYISEKIELLGNPNPKRATLGFKNALDNKLTVIDAPTEELIRVLTEVAKKSAGKA